MPFSRRGFLASTATSLAFSGFAARAQDGDQDAPTYRNEIEGYGPLIPDPRRMLDLPAGFRYQIISQAGETMSDGFLVPSKADGMGCFPAGEDKVLLVRNHELGVLDHDYGPFGLGGRLAPKLDRSVAYDFHDGGLPLGGGTTTILYDLKSRQTLSQHLSLVGTVVNCCGGVTPWGSWLSCEETTLSAGLEVGQDHGYVFEVPSAGKNLVAPVALKAMGRFKHEAACIDPRTGVVYMTEDVADGLFYRFLPNDRRNLAAGGRLQALGLVEATTGGDTRNFEDKSFPPRGWKTTRWIDLDGVENPDDDLRRRGFEKGAALFARGEGLYFGQGELYFTCTSGGAIGAGQIFRYVPSPSEGQPGEKDQPGRLQLFVESADTQVLDYADNLVVSPWGHVIVCEDRYSDVDRNHLRGVTPEGRVYTLGRNVFIGNSEFAGACFSPDGATLFVNIQNPGITLAVTGPWASLKA
jgi:secreted PhoX family phosphatase